MPVGPKRHFFTLADALHQIKEVRKAVGAEPEVDTLLQRVGENLKRIRNRDVHSYTPNVRDADYFLVPDLFVGCFSLVVTWLPDGASTVNKWIDGAAEFVAKLKAE